MWFALERPVGEPAGLERLLPELEGVLQLAADLERRLAEGGGVAGVLETSGRLRRLLDGVSREDLERAIAAAGALERAFADLGRELGELRALRERLCRDRP